MPAVAKRSVEYRGFGVTIEVPESVARAITRFRRSEPPSDEALIFGPKPRVEVDSRQQERAYWVDFAENASAEAHSPGDGDLGSHSWYHTIEFDDGTATDGRFDHRALLPRYGLPPDLSGKRALDVGSGDGFWAFELERRGAEVMSVDIESFSDADLPPALHDIFDRHPVSLSFRRGLEIAHRKLGSSVRLTNRPVYDVDPSDMGTFDFVHAGDLLLHLRDPILALQRIRAVCTGTFLLADCFDPELDELNRGSGLTRYRGGWGDVIWWTPALSTLAQMVYDAGFVDVEVLTTYNLAGQESTRGLWRAVLRAKV
jgi:tRNA (mo5U34)-methyltransferase